MNEELKIIIRATTEQARAKIKQVKDAFTKVKEESAATDAAIKETMGNIARGATVAIGAITALVAGMVALGKTAQENQKQIGRLVSTFQSLGSNAKQAKETYTSLYRFLGDAPQATEAANLLAQITTEEKELAEWTNILKGAYATFPDSLPVEALAEATNETIKVGTVTGNLADAVNWLGVSEDGVNEALASLNTEAEREAYLRSLLNGLYSDAASLYEQNNAELLAQNESQAKLDITMASLSKTLSPMMAKLNETAAIFLTVLTPAIKVASAAIIVFCEWITTAIGWLAALFGIETNFSEMADSMNGAASGISKAASGADGLNKGLETSKKTAQELKRLTMGFDELNVVSSTSSSSAGGSGSGAGAVSVPSIDTSGFTGGLTDTMNQFSETIDKVREAMEGILVLVGAVGLGIAAWKLLDAYTAGVNLLGVFKTIGAYLLIVAGAILLVKGFSDAWVNGVDWNNFALILGGIALTVGGLFLQFGTFGAAIGLVVGGILMLVLGIKDLVENGYSMEAVIMVLVGAIAVAVGIMWAFNAALLANPITWIVIAIAALVAAFVILWNECEGFRNFWKNLWDNIVGFFKAAWDWIVGIFNSVIGFVKDNWQALLLMLVNPFAGAFKLLYDNCAGFRDFIDKTLQSIGKFFSNLWEGIKNTFSKVGTFFKDVFSKAWEGVKNVFSKGGKIFDGIKDGIVTTFKTVVNGIIDGINKVVKLPFEGLNGILNTIHKIEIVGIKPFSWLTWRAPVPQLPKLAKGGIAYGDTLAHIGEEGYKEAVLPLERNTEWMDILADRIASRNATPSKIVLQLDGKELGWANINSINSITAQTGALQLKLV